MGVYIWSKNHTPLIHRAFTAANVLAAWQSDHGVVEGSTLKASGTTPPAITFTGTRVGRPCSITVKCPTTGGARGTWLGTVSYDGGTTVSESFTSAATIALTGKGYGLVLNIPTGNAATDNVWKATIATWKDQKGTKDYAQATAGSQFVIGVGVGNRPGFISDGTDDFMAATGLTLAAPGTTPTFIYAGFRTVSWVINRWVYAANTGTVPSIAQVTATPDIDARCGVVGPITTGAAVGTFTRVMAMFQHTTADYIKAGSASAVTGVDLGNNTGTGVQLAASVGASFGANEYLFHCYLNAAPSAAQLAAADAIAARLYPGLVI
jgi:hypothetical protein